ncbi:MAG TPA: response regulator transcription factor [Terriglobales bacterium]|nr:response regulator transcription factor [Terriglobales bacterium]
MPLESQPDKGHVRIVIADDHSLVRNGLRRILETEPDFKVVGEASDGDEALACIRKLTPDVLLLDLAMPRTDGLQVLRELRLMPHSVNVVMLTAAIDRNQINEAVRLGAHGVVMKTSAIDVLIKSIRCVMDGQYWLDRSTLAEIVRSPAPSDSKFGLTERELQLVALISAGGSNKEIAESLGITEATVKRHLANVFDKTGVSTRLELAVFAMNHGLGHGK